MELDREMASGASVVMSLASFAALSAFSFLLLLYLIFALDRLFIFSGFIVLQRVMQVNQKSEFNLFWKIHNGSPKLPKNLNY